MKKIAQKTRFDKAIQRNIQPHRDTYVAQKKLFPDYEKNYGVEFDYIENPLNPLDLEIPKLKPEQFSARNLDPREEKRVRDEYEFFKNRQDKSYLHSQTKSELENLQKYLDENKEIEVVKSKVFIKYEELRKKSLEFYAAYQEANKMASTEYTINTEGNYADLFRDFSKLVVAELSKQIGILFGHGIDIEMIKGFKKLLGFDIGNGEKGRGLNLFNITSLNYLRTIDDMNKLIHSMDYLLKEFYHRKKLLKYLGPKVNEEIDVVLANDYYKEFLIWMDEYLPYHKEEFVKQAINFLRSEVAANDKPWETLNISYGNLVKFKTYKSVYERAQSATTFGFKKVIFDKTKKLVVEELQQQIYAKYIYKYKLASEFIENLLQQKMSDEEKLSKLIIFCKKQFNIDLRAITTFAINAVLKDIDNNNEFDKEKAKSTFLSTSLYALKSNFSPHFVDESKYNNRTIQAVINDFVANLENKFNFLIEKEDISKFLKLNTNDIDKLSNQIMYQQILQSLDGFQNQYDNFNYGYVAPSFGNIKKILKETDGKFSIENFSQYINRVLDFLPIEILTPIVKNLFKDVDYKTLNNFYLFTKTSYYYTTILVCSEILKRDNKLDVNNLLKIFKSIDDYAMFFRKIPNLIKCDSDDILEISLHSVRNSNTIEKDLNNLTEFLEVVHNEAGNLSKEKIIEIVSNKNFANFSKVGIAKKILKAYAQIMNLGGADGINVKYGKLLNDLIQRGFISSNFKENVQTIESFFHNNQEISPKSINFNSMFEGTSKLESDLATLQMGDALNEMLSDYTPKNSNLFNLDLNLTDNIRFRVLRDKDPRILRIGIETNCCQRIGGIGEVAARDSFVNPLASVLILEWKDPELQDWVLLSQSYFHYVPKEHGYILDNVEANQKNVNKFKNATKLTLEQIYATFADEIKNKLNIKYFLSGKSYSKIEPKNFNSDKRYKDPRHFDNRALTDANGDHYSDYNEKNSIDLLSPKFNIFTVKTKISKAHVSEFSKIIKTFIKRAQNNNQDVRRLQGTNSHLFGPQSWMFINQLVSELNNSLYELSGGKTINNKSVNFQLVTQNPSITSKFTGGLKNLTEISQYIWSIISNKRTEPYLTTDAAIVINNILQKLNTVDFPEKNGSSIKYKLSSIVNNWSNIL